MLNFGGVPSTRLLPNSFNLPFYCPSSQVKTISIKLGLVGLFPIIVQWMQLGRLLHTCVRILLLHLVEPEGLKIFSLDQLNGVQAESAAGNESTTNKVPTIISYLLNSSCFIYGWVSKFTTPLTDSIFWRGSAQ